MDNISSIYELIVQYMDMVLHLCWYIQYFYCSYAAAQVTTLIQRWDAVEVNLNVSLC